MIARIAFVLFMAGFGVPVPQQTFPHEMGPEVKVQYLGKAHVSMSERDAIVALVFKDVKPSECVWFDRTLRKELDTIRIARTALRPKSRDQLLVQASDSCHCGATGNCTFWVVEREGKAFRVLLEADMAQRFSLEPTSSNGYRDILTSTHGSATLQGLVLYKFDGKKYRAADCASVEYELKDDGNPAGPPKLTRMKCGAD